MDLTIHKGMWEEYEQAILADGQYVSDYAASNIMQCHGHGGHSEDVPETFVVFMGSRLIKNGMTQERRDRMNRELYARFAIFDSIMASHINGV